MEGSQSILDMLWDCTQWTPQRTNRAIPLKSMLPWRGRSLAFLPQLPPASGSLLAVGIPHPAELFNGSWTPVIMNPLTQQWKEPTQRGGDQGTAMTWRSCPIGEPSTVASGGSCVLMWLCCLGSRAPVHLSVPGQSGGESACGWNLKLCLQNRQFFLAWGSWFRRCVDKNFGE